MSLLFSPISKSRSNSLTAASTPLRTSLSGTPSATTPLSSAVSAPAPTVKKENTTKKELKATKALLEDQQKVRRTDIYCTLPLALSFFCFFFFSFQLVGQLQSQLQSERERALTLLEEQRKVPNVSFFLSFFLFCLLSSVYL